MAEMASMFFNISYDKEYLELYFKGYADRLEEFVYICYNKLKQFDASQMEFTFKMKKEAWLKDKNNQFYDDPYEQLSDMLPRVLCQNTFSLKHQISIGEEFNFERFVEMSNQILKRGRHMFFSIGNINGNF